MQTLARLRIYVAAAVAVCATLASAGCSKLASDAIKELTAKYTVGGTVTGLTGTGLVLEDNGSDDLTVAANGAFTFGTALMTDQSYAVTVKTQPSNPRQTCTVKNGSGSVTSANVTSVAVSCTTNAVPATTAVGTPLTTPASSSQVIDGAGGSIVSADGRITVAVPAGAVASATTFTIQPITNEAPGGVGIAYRLGPAGQTFATPVDIVLHYSSADLAGTVPDALSLAYQDDQGRWAVYKAVTLDKGNETVTVPSAHFSDWTLVTEESLVPGAARIATGQTQALILMECSVYDDGDPQTAFGVKCHAIDDANTWSANSIPGGNSAVGTVTPTGSGATSATYTAPDQVPAANPVAVSVDALITPLGGNQTRELFVSNITVGACNLSNAKDCTWTGTSSASTSHWKASATVTWKWQKNDPYNPSLAIYVPASGSVTLSDLQPNCQVDSAAQPIADDANSVPPSSLGIDYSTNPPTVSGNGTNLKGWTESCNPPENPPPEVGAVWWGDTGSAMSADGLTIEGSVTVEGALNSTWHFTAN